MKRNQLLIAALCGALVLPTLEGCKKGENDPGLNFKSRNSRISALWTLSSGSWKDTETTTETWVLDDGDCEDTYGDPGDLNGSRTETTSYDYGSKAFSHSASSSYDGDHPTYGDGYAEAQTLSRSFSKYDLTISIKKNGKYDYTLDWSVYDAEQPLDPADEDGDLQQGETFTGSETGSGIWWWEDGGKAKSAITFSNFPTISLNVGAALDIDGDVDFTFISSIDSWGSEQTFEIDMLKGKELVLMGMNTYTVNTTDITDSHEAFESGGDWIDCVKTYSSNTTYTGEGTWTFTSDGKNIKE